MYVFPNGNNKPTPVMNIIDLLVLLPTLPGEIAKNYRILSANTICRVLSGDNSLINIIKNNQQNNGYLSQLLKITLAQSDTKNDDKILSGKLEKLKIKNTNLKSIIETKDIDLRNKDIDLRNKDNVILQLTTQNTNLIMHYADEPDNDKLIEYIIVIRKDDDDFDYTNEINDDDDIDIEMCKHYVIRCQYRSIDKQIAKFVNRYRLTNYSIIFQDINPNPSTLYHRLKQQSFIIDSIRNHIILSNEQRLIDFIRNFNDNI
jgi:hypothetical protein